MELGITTNSFVFSAFLLPGEMCPAVGGVQGMADPSWMMKYHLYGFGQPPPGRRDISLHTSCTPISCSILSVTGVECGICCFSTILGKARNAKCLLFMWDRMELWLYHSWWIFSLIFSSLPLCDSSPIEFGVWELCTFRVFLVQSSPWAGTALWYLWHRFICDCQVLCS